MTASRKLKAAVAASMSTGDPGGEVTMAGLTVKRWTRYGKDRLYVNHEDGSRVGWLDLQTDEVTLEREDLRAEFEHTLAHHRAGSGEDIASPPPPPPAPSRPSPQPSLPSSSVPPPDEASHAAGPAADDVIATPKEQDAFAIRIDWKDLASHEAGKAAAEQARAEREAAPVRTLAARVLRVHTDERAWRIGAQGERLVAARLERLGADWKVLHALPVGDRGSDIDHFVVGPGGVFTINAKNHPDANVWVGGNTFMVNGHRQPYVRNSRHEAKRAARLLSKAVGWDVPVTGIVAVVGARKGMTIKEQPADVHVVTRKQLAKWLQSRAEALVDEQIEAVYAAARRSDTWR